MTDTTPQNTTPLPDRELTGVRNFRDVGGLLTADGRRLRRGRLYRSGHLANATEDDATYLASLGLRTVLDFRDAAGISREGPDIVLPSVRGLNIPLADPAAGCDFWPTVRDADLSVLRAALGDGRGAAWMVAAYQEFVLTGTTEYGRMLRLVAEHESVPLLLHCVAGKDRSGIAIAVILLALGVDRAVIEADYLLSNDVHRRYQVRRGQCADRLTIPEVSELLAPLFEARAEYLAAAFGTMEREWGSTDRYLTEALGCDSAQRARLCELLLDCSGR